MQLKDTLKTIDKQIEALVKDINKIEGDDAPAFLRAFLELKELKEHFDATHDLIAKVYSHMSYDVIPELFERLGFDSVKLGGKNFIVGTRFNATIPIDKREEGFKWLEEHGLGALIQPAVNAKTLSSAIAGYFEENAEMPPPEAMSVHKQRYTSVRKA